MLQSHQGASSELPLPRGPYRKSPVHGAVDLKYTVYGVNDSQISKYGGDAFTKLQEPFFGNGLRAIKLKVSSPNSESLTHLKMTRARAVAHPAM